MSFDWFFFKCFYSIRKPFDGCFIDLDIYFTELAPDSEQEYPMVDIFPDSLDQAMEKKPGSEYVYIS